MQGLYQYFFQFSASQQVSLVALSNALCNLINHGNADRGGKVGELGKPFFLLGTAMRRCADQHGGLTPAGDGVMLERFLQVRFEVFDELVEDDGAVL